MYLEGDLQAGVMFCGQGVGLVKKQADQGYHRGGRPQAVEIRQKLAFI